MVLQVSIGGQNYFYENESLIKRISDNDENNVLHFTHSNDGNTIDIFWEMNNGYYRLKFITENLAHFEKLNNGKVSKRIIVTFGENQNMVETKRENLNTGEFGEPNTFSYHNDNLTGIQLRNDESITISHTDILNTLSYVKDKSYGKKLLRHLCAENIRYD